MMERACFPQSPARAGRRRFVGAGAAIGERDVPEFQCVGGEDGETDITHMGHVLLK